MKYKCERRSKPKSKSSKLDRRKLKKYLKKQGISSLEAMAMLDSSLTPRANNKKHRENRRSDSVKHSTRNHDRQSNGRKHAKYRVERKRRKKSSKDKSKEPSSYMSHISKMNNGHRKHTHTQSPSTSPSPSRRNSEAGKEKKETEASKLIRKMLENMDSDNANTSSKGGRGKDAIKKQSTSTDHDPTRDKYAESSSSNTTDDKRISSKMFRKYSDSFAQYLLDNLSSDSLDSSSDSDSESTDDNDSASLIEPNAGYESPTIITLLDSDEEAEEARKNSIEATMPVKTTSIKTTPTPTNNTPMQTTPLTSPTITDNDHHIRVRNIKQEKKPRSPKPPRKTTRSPKINRKDHRTITHHIQSNDRVNSQSSTDQEEEEEQQEMEEDHSQSTIESENSSDSPENVISGNYNYTYVTKCKRRKKLRPPKLMRKFSQRPIPSNERKKSKEIALKFIVTEEEPSPNYDKKFSPEKRKSPISLSSREKENSHRLALVTYSPRYTRNDENWDQWSNLSEEDDFSDYQNEGQKVGEYKDDEDNDSLHEDFTAEQDDEFIRNGVGRGNYADIGGVRIDFVERPQIIEINMPVPANDDPHQLFVESEETIEYAEAQSEIANKYANNYEDIEDSEGSEAEASASFGNKFPIKIVEPIPDAMNRLTIADIILRMSEKDIDTSVELSRGIVDGDANALLADVTTSSTVEQDRSMIVNEIVSSGPSSISMDDENVPSPNDIYNPHQVCENDKQPFVTTSEFFNASNSKQVLVLLKTKIYFHGALSVRLIAGRAHICGYELIQNETVSAYSPRRDSFLCLTPSSQHIQPDDNNLEIDLHGLPEVFFSSDLERVVCNFNSSTDAILLLESDFSNKGIHMIYNYTSDAIFPTIEIFDNRHHPFQMCESILQCRFLTHTEAGLRINPQWKDVVMSETSRHMIIGGKGVGKSTFLRYLINKNLQQFGQILLIDLDIILPEIFVPQTVSATVITEPILGPGYLRNIPPLKSYLFGDVNVLVSPIKYLKCVLKLLKHCNGDYKLRSMPWVINTMGYSHAFGLELIVAILRALNPTDLIQIQSTELANNVSTILDAEVVNGFCFNILKDEIQYMQNKCTYLTYVCNTMSTERQQDEWSKSQNDLQNAMILSKLGGILQGNDIWITDVRPLCAHLSEMKVLLLSHDSINVHSQTNLLNGNLVYLCESSDNDADEEVVECCGIGIVRSVEMASEKIYLLPAITKRKLASVNVIAICNIPLPPYLLLNQSSRIGGRIPYVYSCWF